MIKSKATLALVAALLAWVSLAPALSHASTPSSWSQYLGGPGRSGFNPNETVLSPTNAGSIAESWSYSTNDEVQSSPAVFNGILYIGSEDGHLYALNATTGRLLWAFPVHAFVDSSPAVSNGVVYFGAWSGYVYALNASTGKKLWATPTGSSIGFSSPAVSNGQVYIGSLDRHLYALNATSGKITWSNNVGGRMNFSPAVANGAVMVAVGDQLFAYSAANGSTLWDDVDPNKNDFSSSPVISNGEVYVTDAPGTIYSLTANGGLQWSYTFGGAQFLPGDRLWRRLRCRKQSISACIERQNRQGSVDDVLHVRFWRFTGGRQQRGLCFDRPWWPRRPELP